MKNPNEDIKSEFKKIVADTAIVEFLRQAISLLNYSLDRETLDDLYGRSTDGYTPTAGDTAFHIEDRLDYSYLQSSIVSVLDTYQYDPRMSSHKEKAKMLIGSRIRKIYDEFNKRILASIYNREKQQDIDTAFEEHLFVIRAFRNNLWSNILPEFLKENTFVSPEDTQDIINRFKKETAFIENHILRNNNPLESGINQLYTKLFEMDMRYEKYYNNDEK